MRSFRAPNPQREEPPSIRILTALAVPRSTGAGGGSQVSLRPSSIDRDGLAREGLLAEVDERPPALLEQQQLAVVLDGPGFAAVAGLDDASIGGFDGREVVLDGEDEPESGLGQQDRHQGETGNRPAGPDEMEDPHGFVGERLPCDRLDLSTPSPAG